jgi:hypothetical protein
MTRATLLITPRVVLASNKTLEGEGEAPAEPLG